MTDLERFNMVDEIRRVCDAQCISYELDGAWTRENVAWIFEKALLQIKREATEEKLMASEAVDRAARAIWDRKHLCDGGIAQAHAALATTRYPTPEMIEAGAKRISGPLQRELAEAVWLSMHDLMMGETWT
jgi:hypothetical protein